YWDHVELALGLGDTDAVERQSRAFQDLVVGRIAEMLASAGDKERRGLTFQLGAERACEDAQVLHSILNARDGLALLATLLPGHIGSLAGPSLEKRQVALHTQVRG